MFWLEIKPLHFWQFRVGFELLKVDLGVTQVLWGNLFQGEAGNGGRLKHYIIHFHFVLLNCQNGGYLHKRHCTKKELLMNANDEACWDILSKFWDEIERKKFLSIFFFNSEYMPKNNEKKNRYVTLSVLLVSALFANIVNGNTHVYLYTDVQILLMVFMYLLEERGFLYIYLTYKRFQ